MVSRIRWLSGFVGACVAVIASLAFVQPQQAHAADVMLPLQTKISQSTFAGLADADREALFRFYIARSYRPAFADEKGLTPGATHIVDELRHAAEWGLDDENIILNAVTAAKTNGRWTTDQALAAEIEVANGVISYVRQARGGRISDPQGMLSVNLDRTPNLIEPRLALADVAESPKPDELLRSYQPQHEQFKRLHALYAKLLAESQIAPQEKVPPTGPYLLPGVQHADIISLRRRLKVTAEHAEDIYDETLADAVKAFQGDADLSDDGIIGPATRKALNGNRNEAKLRAIRANMEQWRWMPADLSATHLFVNVPAFTVNYVENGVSKLEERVIVGKPDKPTPVFSKDMTTIVLRPSWKLPNSIKLEKLASAQRRGGSVEDEGYRIKRGRRDVKSWDVDWDNVNLSEYEFVQPAGESNALGRVKFLFPNRHSVYLHDTPMKSLFNASERLFSHGCVRLRNPLSLAQMLLDREKGTDVEDAEWLAKSGPLNNEVQLNRPIPMHIGYFTVWVNDDGTVNYFDDAYGHQERISLALENKWDEISKEEADEELDTAELKSARTSPQRISQNDTPAPQVLRATAPATSRPAPPPGMMRVVGQGARLVKVQKVQYFKPQWRPRRNSVGDMIRSALGAP